MKKVSDFKLHYMLSLTTGLRAKVNNACAIILVKFYHYVLRGGGIPTTCILRKSLEPKIEFELGLRLAKNLPHFLDNRMVDIGEDEVKPILLKLLQNVLPGCAGLIGRMPIGINTFSKTVSIPFHDARHFYFPLLEKIKRIRLGCFNVTAIFNCATF